MHKVLQRKCMPIICVRLHVFYILHIVANAHFKNKHSEIRRKLIFLEANQVMIKLIKADIKKQKDTALESYQTQWHLYIIYHPSTPMNLTSSSPLRQTKSQFEFEFVKQEGNYQAHLKICLSLLPKYKQNLLRK